MRVADAVPRTVMMPLSQRLTGPAVIGSEVGGAQVHGLVVQQRVSHAKNLTVVEYLVVSACE
jgi:hypothetical protein